MHLHTRNVNTAFKTLVEFFQAGEQFEGRNRDLGMAAAVVREKSRNGTVLRVDEPVMITYSHPTERVLFNSARDANPFFHLYHALWMLAGRCDLAPVERYVAKMREFSDNGRTLNGAYGYRWRHGDRHDMNNMVQNDVDQLNILVEHLKATPNSRRAVLQMWNVEDDLLKVDGKDASKDVCCNTEVMFSLREVPRGFGTMFFRDPGPLRVLDMTVINRSNDLVLGMLGEDYVSFTLLQEYMAARLKCGVGKYHHVTNNLHVYDWNWKPDEWLGYYDGVELDYDRPHHKMKTIGLLHDVSDIDEDIAECVSYYRGKGEVDLAATPNFGNKFLTHTAAVLFQAHHLHKLGDTKRAIEWAEVAHDEAWSTAATGWLQRRLKK